MTQIRQLNFVQNSVMFTFEIELARAPCKAGPESSKAIWSVEPDQGGVS
jgi:hypothetical protein